MASEKQSASKKNVQAQDLPKSEHDVPENQLSGNQWAHVVARAWSDEAFKKRLLAQPAAVLKEAGLVLPEGVEFKVVENTERLVHLTLPLAPSSSELTEESLQAIGGGSVFNKIEWIK